jgi:hypothetical protein
MGWPAAESPSWLKSIITVCWETMTVVNGFGLRHPIGTSRAVSGSITDCIPVKTRFYVTRHGGFRLVRKATLHKHRVYAGWFFIRTTI